MFLGLPATVAYVSPWNEPFEARFRALTARPRRIAYYYSVPDNSTFRYRCHNMVQTTNAFSPDTSAAWFAREDGERINRVIDAADVLVLNRVQFDSEVARMIARARRRGVRILFDVDDLVFNVANIELLIYALNADARNETTWNYWYSYVGRIGATLRLCDGAITTNDFLAHQIAQDTGLPVTVVPNYLNREQEEISAAITAVKQRTGWARDQRIHIGYFSGSPSHARDFDIVAPTLAELLHKHPSLTLRLVGMLDPHPALAPLIARIERHPFTDFINLQRLVGSTEINIAPLQDNVFTNSKSELKYFEASAVGTITIASSVFTFRNAIHNGVTGFLANELEWKHRIEAAIALVGTDGYARMAMASCHEVLERYASAHQWPAIERAVFGT